MAKKELRVVTSSLFDSDLRNIHEYGTETFGIKYADEFIQDIFLLVDDLKTEYKLHIECRHLRTKSKKYRNIIMGAYLIIYRITADRVEVLRAIHGTKSPTSIRSARSIRV